MPKKVRSIDPDDEPKIKGDPDAELVREAKKRFKRCADWESTARERWLEDYRFANADARNMDQWPNGVLEARSYGAGNENEKPCLTINKTLQHDLQIINDGRQNKTSIKVRPSGNEATYEAAQVYEGLFRHIEYISNAQAAYTLASKFQVMAGVGYCRLLTKYVDNESFDQEIYIEEVPDPLCVYLDDDSKRLDGSDARFGFIFSDVGKDTFKAQYPDFQWPPPGGVSATLGNEENAWITEDKIRVAEYYYQTEKADELIVLKSPEGEEIIFKASQVRGFSDDLLGAYKEQLSDPATKRRPIMGKEVKWVKIAGDHIVARKDWVGETIPIYPAVGEVVVIDNVLDRKGHTRTLLDAQRIMNYSASADIEYGALQSKTPYIGPAVNIEELETYWGRANLDNLAFLPYKHKDDDGNDLPAPTRQQPPSFAPAFQKGMENAERWMMLVSGQYQPMMGEPSNERSGIAINARQRQGENATYHFIDNLAMMIRRVGKDVIAIIPKVYDTQRVVQIMGEDGTPSDVMLDPNAEKAYEERKAETDDAAAQVIMNPKIGLYDVMSDVGPDYATRRQEAFNALSAIAQQNPALMQIIGDLVMLAADFPMADEAAERLRRMVPAQAMGDGPNPQVVELQQKLATMGQLMASLSQKAMIAQGKLTNQEEQKGIDVYKAITDRLLGFLKYTGVPAADLLAFQHDLAMQEHRGQLDLIAEANRASLSAANGDQEAA